jgi:hypothetical protein
MAVCRGDQFRREGSYLIRSVCLPTGRVKGVFDVTT